MIFILKAFQDRPSRGGVDVLPEFGARRLAQWRYQHREGQQQPSPYDRLQDQDAQEREQHDADQRARENFVDPSGPSYYFLKYCITNYMTQTSPFA